MNTLMTIPTLKPVRMHISRPLIRASTRIGMIAQLLALAALLALAGCGNKGDLVLPSKTPPPHG